MAAATTLAVIAVAGLAAAQPQPDPDPEPGLPGVAQPAPPGTPFRIGYASTAESDPVTDPEAVAPADVWSADETGGDQRNHTGRPGLRDDGPAFSPDGQWLAYRAHDPAGGARIVVADAEGRDGRTLAPAGTLATDVDQDPTWSPDGTMIAFTRQPDPSGPDGSRILIVRAADGELLAQVPMPTQFVGTDVAPAWSPDGTRIAFARTASQRILEPPFLDPPIVDFPVNPVDEYDFPVDVAVPEIPANPDIVFLIDATGSMEDVIADVRTDMSEIADRVRETEPTARFATAFYRDLADAEPFGVLHPLSEDLAAVQGSLDGLAATGGFDTPEDWIFALHQLATGTPDVGEDPRIVFGEGRSPIVVLVGDASSHEPSGGHRVFDLASEGADDGDTVVALRAVGIRVVAVDHTTESGDGLDEAGQATRVVDRTGGVFIEAGSDPTVVSDAIIEGLLSITVTVEAAVQSCEDGLTAQVFPPSQEVPSGGVGTFSVFGAILNAPPGATLRCFIAFSLGSGTQLIQEVVVRVGDGAAPRVRVNDVTVQTGAETGTVVDYPVTAFDLADGPVTAECTPPSGSLFPVGQTLVTCTATDSDGNTGTDTALINVVLGPADGLTRIWVATLTFPSADAVVVADQVDFSATVGPGCTAGGADTEPAWSPDAATLAFTDGDEATPALCLAEVTGGDARELVGLVEGGRPGNPAWSPDGTLVAFDVDADSAFGEESIWTVPADGALPPEPLIAGGGDHSQPAFRRLPPPPPPPDPDDPAVPALALSATVAPSPGFLGGDDLVVRYTARNDSTVPLVDVELTAELPGALPATAAGGCASATSCALGVVDAGDTVEVLVRLAPEAATDAVVTGEVTGSTEEGLTATATAAAPVRVVEPVLEVSPVLSPPGFVTLAEGSDFPPGAEVRLVWRDGITATDNTVTVAPDGSFTWQALVFRKDALGPRELHAERGTGPAFQTATADFLVVPRNQQPPIFEGRG